MKKQYAVIPAGGVFMVVEMPEPDPAGQYLITVTMRHPHQYPTREAAEQARTEMERGQ